MMSKQEPLTRFRIGRFVALSGVVLAISLAVLSMTLLAVGLLPQIFPTLFAQPISSSF